MFPCLFLVVAHLFIVQCMQKTSVTPAEFKDDVCLIFSSVALKELTKKETNNFGLHRIHITDTGTSCMTSYLDHILLIVLHFILKGMAI